MGLTVITVSSVPKFSCVIAISRDGVTNALIPSLVGISLFFIAISFMYSTPFNTAGQSRTDTPVKAVDFESTASAIPPQRPKVTYKPNVHVNRF